MKGTETLECHPNNQPLVTVMMRMQNQTWKLPERVAAIVPANLDRLQMKMMKNRKERKNPVDSRRPVKVHCF